MFKRSRAFFPSTLLVAALGYLFASRVHLEAQEPVNRNSSAKTREVLRWFYEGEIHSSQARSPEMKSWIGRANSVERLKFNSEVAIRMRELGWQVDQEVRLTKLLKRPFDRDYGDIDVLAWRADSRRVLIMECKDVQYRKTIGEIAEQISDLG